MATDRNEFAGTAGDGQDSVIDPASLGGTAGGSGDDFDPAIHVGRDKRNADGSYTRKRGRRGSGGSGAGSGGRKSKASGDLKDATEALSRTLLYLHVGIASATKAAEMALEQ